MPSWWRKSTSKAVKKKGSKDNLFDALHFRKSKFSPDEKGGLQSSGASRRCSLDTASENGLGPRTDSTSPSPSAYVSRSQSFAERPHGQPLPLPSALGRAGSGISLTQPSGNRSGRSSPCLPLPSPDQVLNRLDIADVDGGSSSTSVSGVSSVGSDEPTELLQDNGPGHAIYKHSDAAVAGRVIADGYGCSGAMHAGQSPKVGRRCSKQDILRPGSPLSSHHYLSSSPRRGFFNTEAPAHLQIPVNGALGNVLDSSMSSPSRSPMRVYGSEQSPNSAFWAAKSYPEVPFFGSGHCSSPGSGHNSGHNSMGGDMVGQPFWQQSRGSPECSPIPSPKMTSVPSSRVQSGAVTPLHPRASGTAPESPTSWPEERKHPCHRLPLPPLSISTSLPYAMSGSASATSSAVPRSPGRADNPPSPGSRWKKGKLLGRGTFGHVYAGLNSESGKMCAMKEVTLFADDPKSKESVKQLAQEIALLSSLSHKNIVQYYGSETVDDKLYIYLEYVSGGSIHKLLQEYGQFGEPIIRSYTRQILAGLAYLHSKSTVHRDIKGANMLVDPNGQVKLADFGMAKHISAHSCPLSFKGSPYWMAPEVIKNSNGYNLAVDIWSLGCTVLEMATTKPPWSEYEGIAAMFKIGNSKELPTIPDFLSDEGKEFVRLCLQRNPANRPAAAQLLEHPFVKYAEPYVKLNVATQSDEVLTTTSNADRSMNVTQGVGHMRNLSSLDIDYAAIQSKGRFPYQLSSEHSLISNAQKNISLPVSPSGSPLMQPRSPHHRNGVMSPSPISTPLVNSGSSTPLTGGHGAIPFQINGALRQSTYADEGFGNLPRSPNGPCINGSCLNGLYHDCRQDFYLGTQAVHTPEGSPRLRDQMAANGDILGKAFGRITSDSNGEIQRRYGGQVALAEHVSQQLLRIPSKVPVIDFRPGSPMIGRASGYDYH